VPVQEGVAEVARAAGTDPLDLAAAGGEDYELLATIAPERMEEAASGVAAAGVELSVIGRVRSGDGVKLRYRRGGERSPSGFDHLRPGQAPPGPA
jgi:thiamine-monophosphate kinase